MSTVISFHDHKFRDKNHPCKVIFHSPIFRNEEGAEKTANICIIVEDGNYKGIIQSAIDLGGIWGSTDEVECFFLPWPCAYVEIVAVEA